MSKKAIIYLHGFNSASLDVNGNLLTNKEKLVVMQDFCLKNDVVFSSPNVDYRDFANIIEDVLYQWHQLLDLGFAVFFMGSSMGGFASEYLALKTASKAIMINPAINPSVLLTQFIGVEANAETGEPYEWQLSHCQQYLEYERAIANHQHKADLTVLLDLADALIDAKKTREEYHTKANVVCFNGGSHSFEHIQQALPVIERVIFS